jgi:hypothetical protein
MGKKQFIHSFKSVLNINEDNTKKIFIIFIWMHRREIFVCGGSNKNK